MSTTYQHFDYPSRRLKGYIDSYSIVQIHKLTTPTFVPKGFLEIIIPLDSEFKHKSLTSNQWGTWPKCFIAGLHNKAYKIQPVNNVGHYLTIKFKTNTAKNFIHCGLQEFKNSVIETSQLWNTKEHFPVNRIIETTNNLERIEVIEDFLIKKFKLHNPSNIDLALSYINKNNGMLKVSDLSKLILTSSSHFRKCFNETIGISPSQYSKIIRVNNAIEFSKSIEKCSLTEITYRLGYFDQSHFIKEFKSVTGHSPKVLRLNNILR